MVWIESITSSAGGPLSAMVVRMSRTEVAAASWTGASPSPSRTRAQPHLVGRFLARDIDDALPPPTPAWPRPGAAGSTCRCPDRRRPASPSRRRSRRRSPGRTRRSRSTAAAGSADGSASSPTSSIARPPLDRSCSRRKGRDHRRYPGPACSTRRIRRTAPASATRPSRRPGRHIGSWAWPSRHAV